MMDTSTDDGRAIECDIYLYTKGKGDRGMYTMCTYCGTGWTQTSPRIVYKRMDGK